MSTILDLASADSTQLAHLGGKGANLAQMLQAGLPVPHAFILPTEAFDDFAATHSLPSLVDTAEQRARLQADIEASAMPEALADEILAAYRKLGGGKVAVRSSATGEDSHDASFAGQHDTFLDIEGEQAVLDAIKRCWASVWSERAHAYRKRFERELDAHRIAVVVQQMIPAEAAGILFTTSPVGTDERQLLIESSWGLGEGIVNGQVLTDSFVVDKESQAIVSRLVRYKLKAWRDGRLVVVPEGQRSASSLVDEQVLELARLALQVRDLFGGEQDIEWATANGSLYLLQARPITQLVTASSGVIYPDPDEPNELVRENTMWSMRDAGEATVGIMTPLSQGIMKYYRDNLHPRCLRATGMWDISNMRPALGYVHGRCYLNVSHWAHKFTQGPPFGNPTPMLKRFCSVEVDFEDYKHPYPPGASGPKRLWATLFWLSQQWRLALWKRSQRVSWQRRQETFAEYQDRDLSKLTHEELRQEMKKREQILVEASKNYFPFYFLAFGSYEALSDLCRKWLPEEGLEQKLKAEISELRTVDVSKDLWNLAEAAKRRPEVRRIICEMDPREVKDALLTSDEGREFWDEAMQPFLRMHGVRGQPPEMEFFNHRWVDDPSLVFSMTRSYIEKDLKIDEALKDADEDRDELTRQALAGLPFFRRWMLRTAIRIYYRLGETRETNRLWAMTETWVLQRLTWEIGRRMVEQGILRSIDELAYVDFRDVWAFGLGEKKPEEISREMIERNRQAHLINRRVPDPPLTFLGGYDPSTRLVQDETMTTLDGIGASPGQARGYARVILDVVTQSSELQPGEILVANFTNATWTPLFLTAAAVVVDIGSVLSHSAIVAREYGIPCVANVQVGTRTIRTGDLITVDGNTGKVYIEERAAAAHAS